MAPIGASGMSADAISVSEEILELNLLQGKAVYIPSLLQMPESRIN